MCHKFEQKNKTADLNVSNADPLFGIGAIRQIGQQQGGGIRQGETVNRLFAVPARRFQRLREQKHAADLRAAVDVAEMHVLPRHIDAYARADALLVDPRAGGDGDDCAIEQEKPRGEHAAGGERQADDGEGQSQFAGAQKHHRAGEERQRRAGDEQQHVHGGLPPERAEGIDGMLARRGREVDGLRAEVEHGADQPPAGRHDEAPASAAGRAVQQLQKAVRALIQAVEIGSAAVAAQHADGGQLVPRRAADAQQKAHAHAQFIREEAAGKQREAKPEQHERADQQHARPAEQPLADAEIAGDGARYGAQAGRAGQVWIAQNANQAHPSFSKQKKALSSLCRVFAGLCCPEKFN